MMRFAAFAAVCLMAAAVSKEVVKRSVVVFDGTARTIEDGKPAEFDCGHAPGKRHEVRVAAAATYLFRTAEYSFEFDPSMAVTVEREESYTDVLVDHPEAIFFRVQIFDGEVSSEMVADIVKGAIEAAVDASFEAGQAKDETRPIGPIQAAGKVFTTRQGDESFENWIGWTNIGGRGYVFYTFADDERRMLSGRLFGIFQRSFVPKTEPTSRPESAPTTRPNDR